MFTQDIEINESNIENVFDVSESDQNSRLINNYLNEIGQLELLTAEEEVELGKRIQQGDKSALNKMIESNLKLVVYFARKYKNRGVDEFDIISEGNIGLMHAAEKFDPALGYRFNTYATFWIREHIERFIMNNSRMIRIPIHVIKELNKVTKAREEMSSHLNSNVTAGEIALHTDMPVDRVVELLAMNDYLSHCEDINEYMNEDDEAYTAQRNIPSVDETPESIAEKQSTLKELDQWVDRLDDVYQTVLCMIYGLRGYPQYQLKEIAQMLDCSVRVITLIKNKALKALASMAS